MTRLFPFYLFLLQLQQVVDSFIIFSVQQNESDVAIGGSKLPSFHTFESPSLIKVPWTHFMPSNIRIAPFPTRAYTDDEFQSIVKKVMGVLYVFPSSFCCYPFSFFVLNLLSCVQLIGVMLE